MKTVGNLIREEMANYIKEGVDKRSNVFLMTYSKVSSGQINTLRKDLKKIGAEMYVSRNRMARRALGELKLEDLSVEVAGQTAFVWSDADSVEVAKTLMNFAKTCEGVSVKAGLLDDRILKDADVKRLSDLPSKNILLAMLLQRIQSPLTRLANVLNGKTRELIYLLKQLSEQKGGK